jgi:catechol 2,3-dioxygenase-like lactoylglutathione lyase family enzyme
MARALREALATKSVSLTHSESLEMMAQALGHADWNTYSAAAAVKPSPAPDAVRLDGAIPVLRIFDLDKAQAFYLGLLGFKIDWQHQFAEGYPLYLQISRGRLRLHLSEHNGDGTPGSSVFVSVQGLDALQAELTAKGSHAQIEPGPHSAMRVLALWDPFGNRLRLAETTAQKTGALPEGYVVPAA